MLYVLNQATLEPNLGVGLSFFSHWSPSSLTSCERKALSDVSLLSVDEHVWCTALLITAVKAPMLDASL